MEKKIIQHYVALLEDMGFRLAKHRRGSSHSRDKTYVRADRIPTHEEIEAKLAWAVCGKAKCFSHYRIKVTRCMRLAAEFYVVNVKLFANTKCWPTAPTDLPLRLDAVATTVREIVHPQFAAYNVKTMYFTPGCRERKDDQICRYRYAIKGNIYTLVKALGKLNFTLAAMQEAFAKGHGNFCAQLFVYSDNDHRKNISQFKVCISLGFAGKIALSKTELDVVKRLLVMRA